MEKGLELCKNYFYQIGEPLLQDRFPQHWNRVAAGLVGKGSDCFGFDDEYSRDHDWGPGFCLWLTDEDISDFGHALSQAYAGLPRQFSGYEMCNTPARLTGVHSIREFYSALLGEQAAAMISDTAEPDITFWLTAPEESLAAAVSGSVFQDMPGKFTAIRQTLLRYYPKNLQQEKLAAYCLEAGKSGQSTYLRSISRGEIMAANGGLQRFCEAVCRMICIFNRQYSPRYKWLLRSISQMPVLGAELHGDLMALCCNAGCPNDDDRKTVVEQQAQRIQNICQRISHQLQLSGFSSKGGYFLGEHGASMLQASSRNK